MINWARVRELRDDVGGDEFADIIEIFLGEVHDIAAALREVGEDHELELHLHALKNAALNLGFTDLSDLCQTTEALAGSVQGTSVDLDGILGCLDASLTQFNTCWIEEVAG